MAPPATLFDGTVSSALTQVTPSLPYNPQSSSRLLQLPAELRLMVLRNVLVRHDSIYARESYDHPYLAHNKGRERDAKGRFVKQARQATVSGYRLTPSIIRTCQRLFHEALHVLYHENNLRIDIQMYWNQTAIDSGLRQPNDAQILFSMLDSGKLLQFIGPHTVVNETLEQFALRFRRFVIVVRDNATPQHLLRLRILLKLLQPVFTSSSIEVTICNSYCSVSSTFQPILESGRHLQLMKSFTLLRCSKFQFTRLSDPAAVAVRDTIMGSTPTVNLSDFDANPVLILNVLLDCLSHRPNRNQELHSLKDRLTEAVANIDVNTFLQTRFDILRLWIELDVNVWMGKFDPARNREYYALARIDFGIYRVWNSQELGCTIFEDGDEVNAQLLDLAKRYNFTPLVDGRADF